MKKDYIYQTRTGKIKEQKNTFITDNVVVSFLTLVKILTCVPPHQERLKRTTNSTYQLVHCGSKEKALGLAPSPHSTRGPFLTSATVRSLSDYIYLDHLSGYSIRAKLFH